MVALTTGLAATVLGILVHVIVLRRLSGPVLFVLVPILLFIAYVIVMVVYGAAFGSLSLLDAFMALTLSMSFGLCYVLLLVGVVYDSPTLALALAISDYGPQGMPTTEMAKVAQAHPFVESRLAGLISSGQITVEGEDFVARQAMTSGMIRLGEIYRRLCGAKAPSG